MSVLFLILTDILQSCPSPATGHQQARGTFCTATTAGSTPPSHHKTPQTVAANSGSKCSLYHLIHNIYRAGGLTLLPNDRLWCSVHRTYSARLSGSLSGRVIWPPLQGPARGCVLSSALCNLLCFITLHPDMVLALLSFKYPLTTVRIVMIIISFFMRSTTSLFTYTTYVFVYTGLHVSVYLRAF